MVQQKQFVPIGFSKWWIEACARPL